MKEHQSFNSFLNFLLDQIQETGKKLKKARITSANFNHYISTKENWVSNVKTVSKQFSMMGYPGSGPRSLGQNVVEKTRSRN